MRGLENLLIFISCLIIFFVIALNEKAAKLKQ